MAKQAWNTVSKTSGTGNSTFTTGASAHTGRASRSSTITVAAAGGPSATLTATQSAAGSILRYNTPQTIPGVGGSITVSGISNESLLTFAISGTGFSIGTPQISTNGETWTNITSETAIKGDP